MDSYLYAVRCYELEKVYPWLKQGSRILEIGAGAGWQSKLLAERGFEVEAIDIAANKFKGQQVWPVQEYDGRNIPFPANHFDVVFSSNVLEHIAHVESFQTEMQRVLRPGGLAIHVLPTATWRLWTSIFHYPFLLLCSMKYFWGLLKGKRMDEQESLLLRATKYNLWESVRRVFYSVRHGERGTSFGEIYLFSRRAWERLFQSSGWTIKASIPSKLMYTGYAVFGSRLSLHTREWLSLILGSSTCIYVLEEKYAARNT